MQSQNYIWDDDITLLTPLKPKKVTTYAIIGERNKKWYNIIVLRYIGKLIYKQMFPKFIISLKLSLKKKAEEGSSCEPVKYYLTRSLETRRSC